MMVGIIVITIACLVGRLWGTQAEGTVEQRLEL